MPPPPASPSPCPSVTGRCRQACGQGRSQPLPGVSRHNAGAPCRKQDAPVVTLVGGARLPCTGWGCPDRPPTPGPCGGLCPADHPAPRGGGTQGEGCALLRGSPRSRHPRRGPAHRRQVAVVQAQGSGSGVASLNEEAVQRCGGCTCGPAQARHGHNAQPLPELEAGADVSGGLAGLLSLSVHSGAETHWSRRAPEKMGHCACRGWALG